MATTKICIKCEKECPVEVFKFKKRSCYTCQLAQARAWKAQNKERANEYTRKWKVENREHVSEYNKSYDAENRDVIQKRQTAYHLARAKTDPNFKLAKMLRSRYHVVLKTGRLDESSLEILGCSIHNFKRWLEFRFREDMTFANHGKVWDLDHVVPIAKFDLHGNEEEIRKCFHWTNFQPLYGSSNKSKNSRVTSEEIKHHEDKITTFLDSLPLQDRYQYTSVDIDRYSYIEKPTRKRSNRGATKVSQE
jgi:hypothetical protein